MSTFKWVSLIAMVNLAVYSLPAQSLEGAYTGGEADFVSGEIIVKMKPAITLKATDLSALGIQREDQVTSGGEIIYRIQPSIMGPLSAAKAKDRTMETVEKLKQRPDVEYAQPNYILHIMKTPNDSLYPKQWHYFNNGSGAGESLGGIDLPKAWDTSTGSQSVVVSVIDTGILPNHEDIVGSPNLVSGYDMISDASRANDGNGRDNDATDTGDAIAQGECGSGQPSQPQPNSWHGSHVAGTIGAGKTDNNLGVAGINWNVKVQAVRVLGKCGGSTSDINDGIRWAAGLSVPGAPTNPTPAKVINMSLGGAQPCSQSPSTQSAINDAVAKGVTVVVAAGNDGKDAAGYLPAGCNNVIAVAASDPKGQLTSYSNFGNTVEIIAPGGLHKGCSIPADGILSTVGNDNQSNCAVGNAYAYYNGTSMAAPHVAGVAALWLATDATLTPSKLLTELQAAARPRNSTQCPKPCGAGLLSAVRKNGTPPPPTPGIDVSLAFDPDKSSYALGETAKARALVNMSGTPQAGKTIQFSSDNTSVASVSPSSAGTNVQGQAEATISANGPGQAIITAEADGKKVQKTFQVPDLSWTGLAILLAGIIGVGLVRSRTVSL